MPFEAGGKLYHYLACHFGGAFSDFWWKRVAALVTDITHVLLWLEHAGHVYVDDWLWVLLAGYGTLHGSLIVLIFVALGVPLSWNKLRFGKEVPWLGLVLKLDIPAWL